MRMDVTGIGVEVLGTVVASDHGGWKIVRRAGGRGVYPVENDCDVGGIGDDGALCSVFIDDSSPAGILTSPRIPRRGLIPSESSRPLFMG
jgi:hypothetical protein